MIYHCENSKEDTRGSIKEKKNLHAKEVGNHHPCYFENSLLFISFSTTSSIQLREPGNNLPYQSSSTGYYSICMILISSDVVNEGQNKLYSGLYQHHIRYKRREGLMKLTHIWQDYNPISKFPLYPHQEGFRLEN